MKMAERDEQTNTPQCFDFSACCSGRGALLSFDHGCSRTGDGVLDSNDDGLTSHNGRGWRLFTQLPDEVGCYSWLRRGVWEKLDFDQGGVCAKKAKGISSHEPDSLMSIPPPGTFDSEHCADEKFASLHRQLSHDCEEHKCAKRDVIASVVFRVVQSPVQRCFEVLRQIPQHMLQFHNQLSGKPGVRSSPGAHVDCVDIGSAGAGDYVFDPGGR